MFRQLNMKKKRKKELRGKQLRTLIWFKGGLLRRGRGQGREKKRSRGRKLGRAAAGERRCRGEVGEGAERRSSNFEV